MLRPADRIEQVALHHDIDLLAAAAGVAGGEVMVMAEAHRIPEPDFLERCDQVFGDNPNWEGFSGRSIPLVHNLLSEIEAEIYAEDIADNLERRAGGLSRAAVAVRRRGRKAFDQAPAPGPG
jgi:hypothetical protein